MWLLFLTSLGVTEPPTIGPGYAVCPDQVKGSTPLPTAVTNNETFFIAEPLSSPPSPIVSEDLPRAYYSGPGTVLADDGLCFSHLGSQGGVMIVSKVLQYRITHFTLDNSAANRIAHRLYHPREGRLWGLIEGDLPPNLTTESLYTISDRATYIILGTFCFDPASSVTQTYLVQNTVASHDKLKFSVFYLEIENNWGGSHVCLCHIKLHGEG